MKIQVTSGKIQEQTVDALIVYLFEGMKLDENPPANITKIIDDALDGALRELIEKGDFTGKLGQTVVLYPRESLPAQRVIVVGLGEAEQFTADVARQAAAKGLQKASDLKAQEVATIPFGTGVGGLDVETSARAIAEGGLLGLYQYHGLKTSDKPEVLPKTLSLLTYEASEVAAAQKGVDSGMAIAAGTNLTRDLVNDPPNICTPPYLAQVAKEIASEVGLKLEVLEEKQMRALKMGALLAVAQGSDTPPRFIILEHNADQADKLETVVLVGKGVTFDTGGYNLKTGEGMATMKCDMAGAAAVLGAMRAVGALKIPLHVVGLVPAADNMINGHAYRTSEVVTASNGTSIEVISTDAEGRMLLADALVYASRYKPAAVVDIATLTGSCMVALGMVAAGLFATDDTLRDKLIASGEAANEKVWHLPMYPEYDKMLESQTADVKHSGGRYGGAGIAAVFLKHFVDYPAWAHIDMAGIALDVKDKVYVPEKGASGFGARLLTEFVQQWATSGGKKQ